MGTFMECLEAQCKGYSPNEGVSHACHLEWERVWEALSWEGIFPLSCSGRGSGPWPPLPFYGTEVCLWGWKRVGRVRRGERKREKGYTQEAEALPGL